MRISQDLEKQINEQITEELWSANLYLSMSFYVVDLGYDGFAAWLKAQSIEETEHAHEFANYLITRGGKALVDKVDVVPQGWGTIEEIFDNVYKHECHVSDRINEIMTLAVAKKDYATQDFLFSFVREQIEEEDSADRMLTRIKQAGERGLMYLDKHILKTFQQEK